MSTERAQRALRLFEEVLAVDPSVRAAWLERVCAGDAHLAAEVEGLLAAHGDNSSFLDVVDTEAGLLGSGTPPDLAHPGTHQDVHPGAYLGDFLVEEQIGAGGMGRVYRAHQMALKRDVALKVLSPHVSHSASARVRFEREARAVARLDHPNIVSVYTTGEEGTTAYYAMELIDGPPLNKIITELRRAPIEELRSSTGASGLLDGGGGADAGCESGVAVGLEATDPIRGLVSSVRSDLEGSYFVTIAAWLSEVADALHYAHCRQVIHRDIKPSNLLLSSDGHLLISDFGLARLLEEPGVTRTGEFIGTPYYMSPEQVSADAGDADARVDVYAIGATLYEMLTLRPPFPGKRADAVLSQILQDEPVSPRQINPQVPLDLEMICLKALEKTPEHRFQTAEELASELSRFSGGQPILSRYAGSVTRAMRWSSRHRVSAVSIAAAAVLTVAALFFAYRSYLAESLIHADTLEKTLVDAQLKMMAGNVDVAGELIDEAEGLGAPRARVELLRGHFALRSGRYQLACDHLEKAVELMPASVAAFALLTRAYDRNEQHDRSTQAAAKLATLEEQTVEDFLFKGQAEADTDLNAALATLDEAIRRDRSNVVGRLIRGNVYVLRAVDTADADDANAALEDLRFASKLLDRSALIVARQLEAHLAAATAYGVSGDPSRRDDHLDRAGKLAEELLEFPHPFLTRRWRAFYWDYVGDSQRAIAEWRRLEQRIAFLVLALYREGDFREAMRLCDERLQKYPTARFTDFFRAFILAAEVDRPEEILKAFRVQGPEALDPLNANRMHYSIHCLAGDLNGAREYSRRLRQLPAAQAVHQGWNQLVLQFTCGDLDAEELIKEAGESRNRQCVGHFLIGVTRLAQGDREIALRHFMLSAGVRTFQNLEDHMSRGLIRQLQRSPKWPSWI